MRRREKGEKSVILSEASKYVARFLRDKQCRSDSNKQA